MGPLNWYGREEELVSCGRDNNLKRVRVSTNSASGLGPSALDNHLILGALPNFFYAIQEGK